MRSGLTVPKLIGVCFANHHKKSGNTEDAAYADCDFTFLLRVMYISNREQEFLHFYFWNTAKTLYRDKLCQFSMQKSRQMSCLSWCGTLIGPFVWTGSLTQRR